MGSFNFYGHEDEDEKMWVKIDAEIFPNGILSQKLSTCRCMQSLCVEIVRFGVCHRIRIRIRIGDGSWHLDCWPNIFIMKHFCFMAFFWGSSGWLRVRVRNMRVRATSEGSAKFWPAMQCDEYLMDTNAFLTCNVTAVLIFGQQCNAISNEYDTMRLSLL